MESLFCDLPEDKKAIFQELQGFIRLVADGNVDLSEFVSKEWKGHNFIPQFNPETAKKAYEELEVEKDTVLVASFPKTGTNWMAEVLRQMLFGHDEKLDALTKALPPPLMALEIWKPEKLDLLKYIPLPRKMYITHLPEELLNFEKYKASNAKIIVPVRNPKDQAVSWFHFSQSKHFDGIRDRLSSDWNQFFSDYVQGKHPMISKPGEWYVDYLLGWYKRKDEENVLFVHFEDMKKNPDKEIKKIANFLNVELSEERVALIARATSFDAMKKQKESQAGDFKNILKDLKVMRKGQVGSWKSTFTVAQSELMDELVEKKLGQTDIKFTYE